MKKFKRVLATLLMLVMLMQPFAMAASVTEFLDFPNDWSTEAMTAAVENGLLIGNGNKLIEPGRNLRRSELAAIITRAFGATITADIGHFDDVKPGDWYYNAVSEAIQMGAMNGTGPDTFHPDKSVTREEVFTTLARVLCIEGTDMSVIDRFSDADEISDWALASVIGLVENGYIDGYPNGTLNPKGDMTRAELAQLFHNLFKTYINTSGYHTRVAAEGSVIVRAPGAHLENVTINGDLIIADGVGNGDFDLNTVTVNGRILARGGEGTVTFKKVTATENVVIFDRNGTVNFNNYRTDVPFKDNLVEYTPATFLTKKPVVVPGPSGAHPSTGGTVTRYNVYFYVDGRIYDSVSVKSGNPVAAPRKDPVKTGYTFVYWSEDKDDDGTGEGFDFSTPIKGTEKLYAIFTKDAVEYEITFDLGDGTTKVVTIGEGEKIDEADVPVLEDTDTQYFKGWETPAGEKIPTDSVKDYEFDEDTVLTPWYVDKDKKVITFYDGDQPFTTVEVPEGGKVDEPAEKPEKDGAEFKHWGASEDAEEPFDFENEVITDDTKLYAVYEYTVKFDGDVYPEVKVIHGKKISNPGDAPEVTGKTFTHWSKTVDGASYNFDDAVTESFTLYAVYSTNKYEITVDGGAPFEVEHGSTIPADEIPEKEDTETQYFKGWTATYEDGTSENIPADEIDEYKVTKPAVITPWYVDKDKNVITFYNGSTAHATQEIPEGGKATKPATDPEKDGAEFKHWGVSEDAETAFDFENTPITEETKLYAVYEYTVSFSGTSFADQKVLHGKTVSDPGDAEEEGKTFKHWSKTVDGDAYDFAAKVTESFKLYPVFETNVYTVEFVVNGTTVDTKDVEHGETVDEPADPAAPAGEKFSHWADASGAEYDFAAPVTGSLTLTAVFVPVTTEKFDVVFKVDGAEVHSEEVTDGGYASGPATEPEDTDEKYFAGWIVEGDTTETVVDLTTYAITEDTTFVAFFKNKLAVTFYDLSLDDAPLFTAYVMPGETLADNQYPHHEDNLGDSVLDLGEDYEGFERNSGIHSVYDGVNYVHTVPMSYWYLAEEGDTEWTVFDSSVVINEDTDVHLNVQEVTVTIDIPKLSATFALTVWAPYSASTRVIDTVKDALFISEETILRGIDTVEDDIMGKLIDKGVIDEDYNIKNINKHITLVQVIGKDNINKYIWEFVGDNASDEDVEKDRQKKAYVNQLVDELCAGGDVTVTEDRLFMFEPIYEKLSKFNYEFIESKVPAQLKQILPMEHIEKLFTRFYDDATYGYATQMKDAMDEVKGNPTKVVYIDSGITIMINPISDIFTPALEYALDMKVLAEGKLSDKFPTYYTYYKANPYTDALEDYLTTDTWFDGTDAGFEGELSGYSLKEFDEYYDIIKAVSVLADDAMLYYYNDVPEADRDAVLDVALTKMLDIANIVKGLLVDYATNGIPESLEEFILSIESDPKLVEYLEKFGVDAYLDKIAGNANADKVYDTAFDKLMGKFGDRIEALLTKFADSKLNRDYDEGEYNKALEVLNGLFTTEEGEAIYTVDTIFEDYLDGVFYKEISAKGVTVSVERDYLTNVEDVE